MVAIIVGLVIGILFGLLISYSALFMLVVFCIVLAAIYLVGAVKLFALNPKSGSPIFATRLGLHPGKLIT